MNIARIMLTRLLKKIDIYRFKNTSAKMKIDKMASVYPCDSPNSADKAVECLKEGQVIAVPTDTIYGLACSANCPEAIQRLYKIKGRDSKKPVAICVSSISDVHKWGDAKHLPDQLLRTLLPGPITVVLEKTESLSNPFLNPMTSKIGIRIPDHKFINEITNNFGLPVALTSANFSNEPSTLSVQEFETLYKHLGAVFDGGILSHGWEQSRTGSTVVDLSVPGCFHIIRKGISAKKVYKVMSDYGLQHVE